MPTLEEGQANFSALQLRAPRMYIQDLKTLETLAAQFNPSKFTEILAVEWNRLVSPGNSHRRMQYSYTDNYKINFELVFDSLEAGNITDLKEARKFLHSVGYSKRGAQNIRDGEATRVLVVWPEVLSLTCVLTQLKIEPSRFNAAGAITYMTATMAFEEIRDTRLFSEDVRNDGLLRTSAEAQTSNFLGLAGIK